MYSAQCPLSVDGEETDVPEDPDKTETGKKKKQPA
jgi:hypothetical protein